MSFEEKLNNLVLLFSTLILLIISIIMSVIFKNGKYVAAGSGIEHKIGGVSRKEKPKTEKSGDEKKEIAKHRVEKPKNDYPYVTAYKTERDVREAFEAVKKYKLYIVQVKEYEILNIPQLTMRQKRYKGQISLISVLEGDYHKMNWLSDWFNQKVRVTCKRYDEEFTPLEYWQKHREEILKMNKTPLEMSDYVYGKIRGCNNFRSGLLTGFIKMYAAKSVLDISAGWGDRLIGAIAAGVRYVGCDPNLNLHPGYDKIIETFVPTGGRGKYTLIKSGFETAQLPEEQFDLVFTSPPYFDLEVYDSGPEQSVVKYGKLEDWYDKFLLRSLDIAWHKLNSGGHMCININNIRGATDFVMRMVAQISRYPDAKYLGVLPYAEKIKNIYKSPQPIWVWQRVSQLFKNDHIVSPLPTFTDLAALGAWFEISVPLGNWYKGNWNEIAEGNLLVQPHFNPEIHGAADSIYIGCVPVGKIPNYIWQKIPSLVKNVNPKLQIDEFDGFRVVRDDLLPGGTKQRAAAVFADVKNDELIYAGTFNGIGQTALAISAKIYGKKSTVIMQRDDHPMNVIAKQYGCKIIVYSDATHHDLEVEGEAYAKQINAYLIPFGMDFPQWCDELYNRLVEATEGILDQDYQGRIWMTAGSATMLSVLYRVYPKAQFGVIQVGRTVWQDRIQPDRTKLYIAPEKYSQEATEQPPYKTVGSFDAKLWQFIKKEGQKGDVIWNSAGHKK